MAHYNVHTDSNPDGSGNISSTFARLIAESRSRIINRGINQRIRSTPAGQSIIIQAPTTTTTATNGLSIPVWR